jgi:enoyl-CoA hydratase
MSDHVRTMVTDGIIIITLNRPEVRNAIDFATATAIAKSIDILDNDPTIAAGILTGAGGTFCAGMDLKAFLLGERPIVAGRGFAGIVERPPTKPIIAAVEGHAIAGGFEIALACDIIVAAENAQFGLPEVQRGLVAAGGGLLRLPSRVPYHLAMEWVLTGEPISAAAARSAGLVNRIADPGGALAAAHHVARKIAGNAPLAVVASKSIINQSREWAPREAFERQRQISSPVQASHDAREGAAAFKERRKPKWEGR